MVKAAIFSLPRKMERLKTCNTSISQVPKHPLAIRLISSYPALFFVFKENNASLGSLIKTAFFGWQM